MEIDFRGGPYDGLRLTDRQVRRYTCPLRVRTRAGVRYFSLLPRPRAWGAVLAGRAGPAESGAYAYELVLTPGRGCGAEYVDAVEDGSLEQALDDGYPE